MFQNADEVKQYIEENDVKFVDVRFCDLPGVMQHFTIPARAFDPAEELAFDGSSIRGFQAIHESDMALRADITTARLDPFRRDKTLNINFFIHDPITGEAYSRDPRNIAKKAEAYLASTGIADTAFFGPEAEFYVFDSVRFATSANEGFYHIDSEAEGLEHRFRGEQPRLQGPLQGWLLPRSPGRPLRRPARRDLPRTGRPGPPGRAPAPRGRHRWPGRDQLQVQHAARRGRRPDALQVRREERRLAQRQDRDLHAEADLR